MAWIVYYCFLVGTRELERRRVRDVGGRGVVGHGDFVRAGVGVVWVLHVVLLLHLTRVLILVRNVVIYLPAYKIY